MPLKLHRRFLTACTACVAASALFLVALAQTRPNADDPARDIPPYQPIRGQLAGNINCVGSAMTTNLIDRWANELTRMYPKLDVTITSGGSDLAPPALTEGKAQIAAMSRPMTSDEIAAFQKKLGYPPTRIAVALDAVAVFVEKNNPVNTLTLQQIDSIFSRTLNRGGKAIRTWGELGVKGPLENQEVVRYGPAKDSGTMSFFKNIALQNGEFTISYTPIVGGGASVIQGVAADPAGIGFGSIVLDTKRSNPVSIKLDTGEVIEPTFKNVADGKYPLTRELLFYINKPPNAPLDSATTELIKFALSQEGQRLLIRDGNLPLTPKQAQQGLQAIGAK